MTSTDTRNRSFSEVLQGLGLFGGLIAGFIGLLVSIVCVMIPGLHFILGPFGPLVGGLVVGNLTGGAISRALAACSIMAIGMAAIALAFTGVLAGDEPASGIAKAAPFIVFFYTGISSVIGAILGTLIAGPGANKKR